MALRPAIFLDKDGTVLQDVPYNVDPERMTFAPSAREAVARLGRLGVPLFIISNQPGIALGLFEPDALQAVRQRLEDMFRAEGAALQGFYYCPHHPEGKIAGYRQACACRKPAPGLVKSAAEEHQLDLTRSWFVGDILDDIETGRRVGCHTILIDNGNETEWVGGELRTPHYTVPDMNEASKILATELTRPSQGVLS